MEISALQDLFFPSAIIMKEMIVRTLESVQSSDVFLGGFQHWAASPGCTAACEDSASSHGASAHDNGEHGNEQQDHRWATFLGTALFCQRENCSKTSTTLGMPSITG